MKRKKILFVSIPIIVFIIVLVIIPIITTAAKKIDYQVFADIAELDTIPNVESNEYEDTNLKGLNYLKKRSLTIKYGNMEYQLFAYTFNSVEDSRQYFQNIYSGNKPNPEYTTGLKCLWLFDTRVIVRKQCNAYYVKGGFYTSTADFINFLNDYLSDDIP